MTPDDFRVWQARMGYNNKQVAIELEVSEPTVNSWRSGVSRIKRQTQLACKMLLQMKCAHDPSFPDEISL